MGCSEAAMDAPDSLDQEEQHLNANHLGDISCTTFNILAPIYKRLNSERRESDFREYWLSRNECILERLLHLKSSIICLQEFWVGNEELVGMYEKRLTDAGYVTYKLARTNNRGLLTAVHQNHFQVLNYKELLFNDFGDRVAQILHVKLVVHFSQKRSVDIEKEALIVNTHLLFPHNSSFCFPRLQQVYKILQYIRSYCEECQIPPVPIILCGDWNGSKKGHVYKFLRSQGFVSSYDIAHHYTDSDEDAHKWVSHLNHRGNLCGVDFIWLYNPNNHRKPMNQSFMEAVLGNIKSHLFKVSIEGTESLHLLKTSQKVRSYITYSQFSQTLTELGIPSHPLYGCSIEEIKALWDHVDTDRDGVIDFSHLDQSQRTLNLHQLFWQREEDSEEPAWRETLPNISNNATTIGFNVKNAFLFPPEVERGIWPENYSLSDHAHLTVEFSLVRLQCY
ncbi:PREDICTED: uncharacterized calcium-binding protein At1g02270-like isoform X2 [Nelumbo nucifera]|uniref:Uncharacterized calcium-binding protein At1g02270-like isoform X2 n=1 Tax=Nelumbo nucifera TaxID=4432 RepID=A0A1U7ZEE6_NELNU|nr:PREDICTED: uncharacterized calcium-binding protein At1g02270-like isoform X2 [Nelumbo nucifera]